jgi:hypothetical protein
MKPIDLNQQVTAVIAIQSTLQVIGVANDTDLLLDSIAGETDLFELIDRLLEQIADDGALAEAIDAQIETLRARKVRLARRSVAARDVIEQAFLAADLPTVERPLATLYLSARPPKLVVETESAIPARYWRPGDPVLDKKQLGRDLKARQAELEALLAAPAATRETAAAAFHQRFLSDVEAKALHARLVGLAAADSPEAREVAVAALRRDFAAIPGASLAAAAPTLTIRTP